MAIIYYRKGIYREGTSGMLLDWGWLKIPDSVRDFNIGFNVGNAIDDLQTKTGINLDLNQSPELRVIVPIVAGIVATVATAGAAGAILGAVGVGGAVGASIVSAAGAVGGSYISSVAKKDGTNTVMNQAAAAQNIEIASMQAQTDAYIASMNTPLISPPGDNKVPTGDPVMEKEQANADGSIKGPGSNTGLIVAGVAIAGVAALAAFNS